VAATITELLVRVGADVAGAITGLEAVDAQTKRVTASINEAGAAMGLAGVGLVAGFAAAGVASVKMAADFQTSMTNVQNNTTMTTADVGVMKQAVLDLGAQSGAPLKTLADGYMHVQNIVGDTSIATDILTVATKSAISTGGDASKTANVLANAMHEYGADVSTAATEQQRHNEILTNATKYMGIFHLAAAEGNMTLEQFANASGRAVGTAANLHIPVEQVATALASLTRHGYNAAEANTQVVNVMTHLVNPTKQARTEIEALSRASGVNLEYLVKGEFATRGLTGVLADLTEAYHKSGMSQIDAEGSAMRLINAQRGGLGLMNLLGTGANDYAKTLADLSDKQKLATITDDAYARTQETLNNHIAVFKVQVQEAGIALGEKLTPIVLGVADGFSAFGTKVNAAWESIKGLRDAVGEMVKPLLDFAGGARGIGEAIGIAAAGLIAYRTAMLAATAVQLAWSAVQIGYQAAIVAAGIATRVLTLEVLGLNVAMLANPVAAVIVVVGAFAIAIKALYDHWKPFHDLVTTTWDLLRANPLEGVKNAFNGLTESVGKAFAAFAKFADVASFLHLVGGAAGFVRSALDDAGTTIDRVTKDALAPFDAAAAKATDSLGAYVHGTNAATDATKIHYDELATIPDSYHQVDQAIAATTMSLKDMEQAYKDASSGARELIHEQERLNVRGSDTRLRDALAGIKDVEQASTAALLKEKQNADDISVFEIAAREATKTHDLVILNEQYTAHQQAAENTKRLADQVTEREIKAAEDTKTAILATDRDKHDAAIRGFEDQAKAAEALYTQEQQSAKDAATAFIDNQHDVLAVAEEAQKKLARDATDAEAVAVHNIEVHTQEYEAGKAREKRAAEDAKTEQLQLWADQLRGFEETQQHQIRDIETTKTAQLHAWEDQLRGFEEAQAAEIRGIENTKAAALLAISEETTARERQAQARLKQIDAGAAAEIDVLKAQGEALKRSEAERKAEQTASTTKGEGPGAAKLLTQYYGLVDTGQVAAAEQVAAQLSRISTRLADEMHRDTLNRQQEALREQEEAIKERSAREKAGITADLTAYKDAEAVRRRETEATTAHHIQAIHDDVTRYKDALVDQRATFEADTKKRIADINDETTRYKDNLANQRAELEKTTRKRIEDIDLEVVNFKAAQAAIRFQLSETLKHRLQTIADDLTHFKLAQTEALEHFRKTQLEQERAHLATKVAALAHILEQRRAEDDHYRASVLAEEALTRARIEELQKQIKDRDNAYIIQKQADEVSHTAQRQQIELTAKTDLDALRDRKVAQDRDFALRGKAIQDNAEQERFTVQETARLEKEGYQDATRVLLQELGKHKDGWTDASNHAVTSINSVIDALHAEAAAASALGTMSLGGIGSAELHDSRGPRGPRQVFDNDPKAKEAFLGMAGGNLEQAAANWKQQAGAPQAVGSDIAGSGAGDAPPDSIGAAFVKNANNYIGSQDFINLCEQWIEKMTGLYQSGHHESTALQAAADWGSKLHSGMPTQPGSLVYYGAAASNHGDGHVGIYEGGGQMASALNNGIGVAGVQGFADYNRAQYLGYVNPGDVAGRSMSGYSSQSGRGGGSAPPSIVINVTGNTLLGRDDDIARQLWRIIEPQTRQTSGYAAT